MNWAILLKGNEKDTGEAIKALDRLNNELSSDDGLDYRVLDPLPFEKSGRIFPSLSTQYGVCSGLVRIVGFLEAYKKEDGQKMNFYLD